MLDLPNDTVPHISCLSCIFFRLISFLDQEKPVCHRNSAGWDKQQTQKMWKKNLGPTNGSVLICFDSQASIAWQWKVGQSQINLLRFPMAMFEYHGFCMVPVFALPTCDHRKVFRGRLLTWLWGGSQIRPACGEIMVRFHNGWRFLQIFPWWTDAVIISKKRFQQVVLYLT